MDEYKECEECHQWKSTSQYRINDRIERHHIVFKSHAPYMKEVPMNWKDLCSSCHRDSKRGVHHNKAKEMQYKQELQLQYEELFCNEFYNIHQIRTMLNISKKQAEIITKRLPWHKEGYKPSELIYHMMGDENPFAWEEKENDISN